MDIEEMRLDIEDIEEMGQGFWGVTQARRALFWARSSLLEGAWI